MKRLPQFHVYRAGVIGGKPFGSLLETIGARDHAAAKQAAEELYRGIAAVVVLPAGRVDSTPSAVTNRDRRADGGRARTTHPRPRP